MARDEATSQTSARQARKLRVGAWCRTAAFEKAIRSEAEQLGEAPLAIVLRGPSEGATAAAWADGCDVLIVDIDIANPNEFDLLSRVVKMRGARRAVIATASDAGIDDVRRLMRLGISDFLPQPVPRAELEHSLSSIAQRLAHGEAAAKRGATLVFMRAAGGSGATTLATHVAYAMAAKQPQGKIALLDLDLQRGAAGLHMDIASDVGVVNCLERYPDIKPGLIASIASKHSTGIDVFVATPNRWPVDDYSHEAIAQLLDVMRRSYDLIVIDTPPVWTRWHRALIERTDVAVVVMQRSVANLRLGRSLIAALKDDLQQDQIVTVCNRVQQSWLGREIGMGDVERALGRAADCRVPSDDAVSEAVDLGVPISRLKSSSKFEKATIALTDEIELRLKRRGQDATAHTPEGDAAMTITRGWLNDAQRAAV